MYSKLYYQGVPLDDVINNTLACCKAMEAELDVSILEVSNELSTQERVSSLVKSSNSTKLSSVGLIDGNDMVKVIRKRYKNSNLIVVTAHPDIFLNNPDVNKVYKHENTNGFYLKYIKNQECTPNYITKEFH